MDPLSPLLLGATLASLLALPFRRADRRAAGALVAGAASAIATGWQLPADASWTLVAFGVGALLGWIGVGSPSLSRAGSFGDVQGLIKGGGAVAGPPLTPSRFADPAVRLRLDRAVYAAESSGEAELVVALVERCNPYTAIRWRFAALLSAVALLAAARGIPAAPPWALLGTQGVAGVLAFAATRAAPVLRLLLPRAAAHDLVEARARTVFFEAGLHHAVGGAAALIFVATFERRFVIVADDGQSPANAPDDGWATLARELEAAFAGGDGEAGLEAAVGACARQLNERGGDRGSARYRDLALLNASVLIDDPASER